MVQASTRQARYNAARRHERTCWEVLVRHATHCPACQLALQNTKQHGTGCVEGRACRGDWIRAANRKYELSPKKRMEENACRT